MNKVIFLVGGPGSGKDIILKNILKDYNLLEFTLEQVNSTFVNKIQENDKRRSILQKESFVISTNAYNYEGIKTTKNLLENFGYESAMIFVDVDDDVSKQRLSKRENFSEESRVEKLNKSKENINKFYTIFEEFIKYDNNDSLEESNELKSVYLFCEFFIHSEKIELFESEDLNTRILEKYSFKQKKIKKKSDTDGYPPESLTKVKTDRIGDEYSIRNSGMGFPTTVGAIYSESFSEYEPELSSFSSYERSTPPTETLPNTKEVQKYENKKAAVKKIKKIAVLSWKGGK